MILPLGVPGWLLWVLEKVQEVNRNKRLVQACYPQEPQDTVHSNACSQLCSTSSYCWCCLDVDRPANCAQRHLDELQGHYMVNGSP